MFWRQFSCPQFSCIYEMYCVVGSLVDSSTRNGDSGVFAAIEIDYGSDQYQGLEGLFCGGGHLLLAPQRCPFLQHRTLQRDTHYQVTSLLPFALLLLYWVFLDSLFGESQLVKVRFFEMGLASYKLGVLFN